MREIMNRKKLIYSIPFLIIGFLFVGCINDDDGNPPNPFPGLNEGDIKANRFMLTFILDQDTTNVQTVEFSDPDGSGGNDPIVADTLKLMGPVNSSAKRSYSSSIDVFNGSNSVSDSLRDKEDEYVICYRDMNTNNLELKRTDLDKNGKRLGFNIEWSTVEITSPPQESGEIRVTLNFQPSGKDGLCDPGINIMEGIIPYKVEF